MKIILISLLLFCSIVSAQEQRIYRYDVYPLKDDTLTIKMSHDRDWALFIYSSDSMGVFKVEPLDYGIEIYPHSSIFQEMKNIGPPDQDWINQVYILSNRSRIIHDGVIVFEKQKSNGQIKQYRNKYYSVKQTRFIVTRLN